MNALQENLPLSAWTTLGVGGPARYFLNATSEKEVIDGLDFAKGKNLPLFVLGGGSNLLVADRGFEGLVLRVGLRGLTWEGAELCSACFRPQKQCQRPPERTGMESWRPAWGVISAALNALVESQGLPVALPFKM